ncbi:MAG TPA: calcium-binding protein [Baekduia sp.]
MIPISPRRALTLALASTSLLALPGAAHAAVTASSDGTTITVTGSDAPESIALTYYDGAVSFTGAVTAGPGCSADEWTQDVSCPGVPGGVNVSLRGGDDRISSYMADAPSPKYARYDMGAGNDFFEGYGSEVVQGGAGNDKLDGLSGDDDLDGGDGNDTVDGGDGADVIRGGAGDDILKSDPMEEHSADVIDGGPGRDSITDWMRGDPATEQLVTVTLDGVADDGFPGEGDNVTNMELVESYGSLRYVGTDGDDIASASEVGNRAELTGKGGNDQLKGTDADDAIDGGAGGDTITGGYGNDTIVGGPGPDKIVGDRDGRCNEMRCDLSPGSSSDTIDAADGEVDNVSCGPGQDTVKADAADVVAPDCETVTRAGAAPAPVPPGTATNNAGKGTNNAGGKGTGHAAARLAVAGRPTLRALLRGGLTITVKGRRAGAKVSVSLKRGRTVVAKGSGKAAKAGTAKVKVKATAAGRRALRRAKTAKLVVAAGTDHITITLKR